MSFGDGCGSKYTAYFYAPALKVRQLNLAFSGSSVLLFARPSVRNSVPLIAFVATGGGGFCFTNTSCLYF